MRCFELPTRNRIDAGPEDLGRVRARDHRQSAHGGHEWRQPQPNEGQRVVHDYQQNQQGDRAEDIDVDLGYEPQWREGVQPDKRDAETQDQPCQDANDAELRRDFKTGRQQGQRPDEYVPIQECLNESHGDRELKRRR